MPLNQKRNIITPWPNGAGMPYRVGTESAREHRVDAAHCEIGNIVARQIPVGNIAEPVNGARRNHPVLE